MRDPAAIRIDGDFARAAIRRHVGDESRIGGTAGLAVGLICDSERAVGIGATTGGVAFGGGSIGVGASLIGTLAVGGSASATPANAKVKATVMMKARLVAGSSQRQPTAGASRSDLSSIVGFSRNSGQGGP